MIYATVEELAAGWRPLTPEEELRAKTLLKRASLYLDVIVEQYNIDVVKKAEALSSVCCDLVQRKLESVSAAQVSSVTQTAGAFSETVSYSSNRKSWELYPEDEKFLGIRKKGGGMIKPAMHDSRGNIIDW